MPGEKILSFWKSPKLLKICHSNLFFISKAGKNFYSILELRPFEKCSPKGSHFLRLLFWKNFPPATKSSPNVKMLPNLVTCRLRTPAGSVPGSTYGGRFEIGAASDGVKQIEASFISLQPNRKTKTNWKEASVVGNMRWSHNGTITIII